MLIIIILTIIMNYIQFGNEDERISLLEMIM